MRFKKYVCTSDKAIKDKWNPCGCLYEWHPGTEFGEEGCVHCGMPHENTVWYNLYLMMPYWLRQNHIRNLRRSIRHFYQRRTRGFDDSDLWNLDCTIGNFVAPRLRAFIDQYGDKAVPSGLAGGSLEERSQEWIAVLEKIHEAFRLMKEDDWDTVEDWEKQKRTIAEGLELFKEWHRAIWD